MALRPLFSTYKQGENRVTASLLAVLERLGIHLTERVLAGLLEEPELSLVSFEALPSTPGAGNPDGQIRGSFHYLFEVKTARQALANEGAAKLKLAYRDQLGDDPNARLLILTPDSTRPSSLSPAVDDKRVVWVNFARLSEVLRSILDDDEEPAGERERYLIRELLSLFRVEGLLDDFDTIVVAARNAYPAYLRYGAYICQPNRAIRPVQRMAFYTGKEIKDHVPVILGRQQNLELSHETVERLRLSNEPQSLAIADIVERNLMDNFPHSVGNHDVYWLSSADDARTSRLQSPVPYLGPGAFTMGQRYVEFRKLVSAESCEDLVSTDTKAHSTP